VVNFPVKLENGNRFIFKAVTIKNAVFKNGKVEGKQKEISNYIMGFPYLFFFFLGTNGD
jgi:hypothetical protein